MFTKKLPVLLPALALLYSVAIAQNTRTLGTPGPFYLVNRATEWSVVAVRIKYQNEANWHDWQSLNPPIPNTCTYPDKKQCASEGKWQTLLTTECGHLFDAQIDMLNKNNGQHFISNSHNLSVKCAWGFGWTNVGPSTSG